MVLQLRVKLAAQRHPLMMPGVILVDQDHYISITMAMMIVDSVVRTNIPRDSVH